MNQESSQEVLVSTKLEDLKTATITNWQPSPHKTNIFIGDDQSNGTRVELLKSPDGPDAMDISLGNQYLVTLFERIPENPKVYTPSDKISSTYPASIAKAIDEAKTLGLTAIMGNNQVWRYTTNGNLYRLFLGVIRTGHNLLPQNHYMTVMGRLYKSASATLQLSFELKRNKSQEPHVPGIPSMEQIEEILAMGFEN